MAGTGCYTARAIRYTRYSIVQEVAGAVYGWNRLDLHQVQQVQHVAAGAVTAVYGGTGRYTAGAAIRSQYVARPQEARQPWAV